MDRTSTDVNEENRTLTTGSEKQVDRPPEWSSLSDLGGIVTGDHCSIDGICQSTRNFMLDASFEASPSTEFVFAPATSVSALKVLEQCRPVILPHRRGERTPSHVERHDSSMDASEVPRYESLA